MKEDGTSSGTCVLSCRDGDARSFARKASSLLGLPTSTIPIFFVAFHLVRPVPQRMDLPKF